MAKPKRMTERGLQIAHRVREMRNLKGMTQAGLAEALGVTYQQVNKYESGINRIPSDRLAEIAEALDVSPLWFFTTGPIHTTENRKAA